MLVCLLLWTPQETTSWLVDLWGEAFLSLAAFQLDSAHSQATDKPIQRGGKGSSSRLDGKNLSIKMHSLGEAGLGQSRHYSLMKFANETGLSVILQAIFQGQSPHPWSLTHVCLKQTFHWGDSLAEKGGREPDHVDSWKDEIWKQGSQSTHAPPPASPQRGSHSPPSPESRTGGPGAGACGPSCPRCPTWWRCCRTLLRRATVEQGPTRGRRCSLGVREGG